MPAKSNSSIAVAMVLVAGILSATSAQAQDAAAGERATVPISGVPNPAEGDQAPVRRGNFSLVEKPAGIWGVIWNLRGFYEVAPHEVVVTVQSGTATLSDVQARMNRPVQLKALQFGVCARSVGKGWTIYPRPGAHAVVVSLNDFALDKGATYNFSPTTVKIPLPESPLPVENWLCGLLLGQPQNAGVGNYPAHNDGRSPLVVAQTNVLAPHAEADDNLGRLTVPTTKTDVLAGRLKISVPTGAKLQAAQHGLMAAPETDYEQTRVLIDAGDQRMVVMVYESFARAETDFEGAAQKETARFRVKVNLEKWSLSAPVRAVAYFPVMPTNDQEANLVMGVFVSGSDGSVQNLVWYVNKAAATQSSEALNLAKSMAKTIELGSRALDTTRGEREFYYSKTKSVFITVPEGYVITAQRGIDFVVHHVHKITVFGDGGASIGVYLGDHPSASRKGFPEPGTSSLFGKWVPWYQEVTNENGGRTIIASALVPLGPLLGGVSPEMRNGPSYADVFLTASDAWTIEELKSIATSLRLGERNMQH